MEIIEIENDILSRYPGNSLIIRKHIHKAAKQLLKGQTIGNRCTPVVSFWLMRDKWRDRGVSWEQQGWDGDIEFQSEYGFTCPAALRLVYFRTYEGLVCQLAYVIQDAYFSVNPISPVITSLPHTIEKFYSGHFGVSSNINNDESSKTPDQRIIDQMGQIYG